jgi:enoyl-CoA hydratase
MWYETLELVRSEEGVALLTIQRPQALNALNVRVLEELADAFSVFEKSEEFRVCIVTGAGEKAFVAGADIRAMSQMSPLDAQRFCRLGQEVLLRIESIEKPVLAAVNGFALGGGCELMLACDMIFASDKARFGQPEINLGVIPGFGGTQRLTKAIGPWRARQWIYLGEMIDAQTAFEMGLVNAVFPAARLMEEVVSIAGRLSAKPPFALGQAKKAIQAGLPLDLATGMMLEREAFAMTFSTQDRTEGMSAFLEKRKAIFLGK